MSDARLPINHGDTGKVSRDKINDSFNDLVTTVAGYRPHIESGIRWIGTTNTGVQAKGDNVEMKVEDGYIRYKSSSVNNWTQIIAIEDLKGDKGDTGDAATVCVGTVCTGAAGSDVCVTNSGTQYAAVLNFTIPQGATGCTGATGASICAGEFVGDDMVFTKDNGCTVTLCGAKNDLKGDTGSAATIEVGCVTTGEPGTSVIVTNSGTCCAAVLDFTIPQGAKGDEGTAATITVGTTTTGESGTCACVTNTGTCNAAVLNFTIPKGVKGEDGCDGASICAAAFSGDDMVFTRDDSCTVTIAGAKTALKGDTGNAATVTVGSTTTGEPGGDACVINSGTSCAAVLEFVIPTGATGPAGNGILCTTCVKNGKVTTVTTHYTNGTCSEFTVSDGEDGQGSGDMLACVYDTCGCAADAFDYCNFYNTPPIPTDNCQLANGCGYTTCTGTVVAADLATYAKCCDIPTNNCQLANGCGYTTCTGTLVASDLSPYAKTCDLGTAASKNTGTSSGNVPVLDSNGKLNNSVIPGVALTDTFTVANKSGLTSLSNANQGDIGIVTGENKTYVLSVAPYSCMDNWKELLTPTDAVTSVNGQTGAVVLSIPTNNCELTNGCGYIKGINCSDVTTALGYTPYNSTNPSGYTTCTGTLTSSNISNTAYGSSWDGVTTVAPSKNAVYDKIESVITSIPTNNNQLTNGCGYTTCTGTISTCSQIISTLGYTPYNSSNPSGYTTCTGTLTSSDLACYACCCDIPTNNCQLTNGCGYTTCIGTLTAETVVSGDSGCTYTIKKSTTAPSGAGSNTITLVVE